MSTTVLRLGNTDQGTTPTDLPTFFAPYHMDMTESLKSKLQFRDEGDGVWRSLTELSGNEINNLQQFLKNAGFMPNGEIDGIFGYRTCASVRLFQEYVRTIEGNPDIGTPDGVVGPNTKRFIEKWKSEKAGTPEFVCKWGRASIDQPSVDFEQGMAILQKAKDHYLTNENNILNHINQFSKTTDTKKIIDWNTDPNTIHLIGVRRNQDLTDQIGRNDDLFVLLIRGMAFCFWGSTDPNPGLAKRKDIPYLIEGQHNYRFGWHKVSNSERIYKALRPASTGVLVFRNRDDNNALTDHDIINGLDPQPNTTINIHWSGIGRTNFSAGCQVIAGKSYLNNEGQLIDCTKFASTSYGELGKGKTRGAYNVISDLILSYAPPGVHTICYTLGRDENSELWDSLNNEVIAGVVDKLKHRGTA